MARASTATQRLKTVQCSVCGKPMQVGSNSRKALRCLECGLAVLSEEISQMRRKSGPHYEHWLAGMRRRFADE